MAGRAEWLFDPDMLGHIHLARFRLAGLMLLAGSALKGPVLFA
jgi:hypothetical protein